MKKKHLFFLFPVLLIIIFINFKKEQKLIKKLVKDDAEFCYQLIGELINKSDEFPKRKEDIEYILMNINRHINNFENYDIDVLYDKNRQSTKVYINRNNQKNKFLYLTDQDNYSFKDYIENFNSNIILIEFFEEKWDYDFCRIKNKKDLSNVKMLSEISDVYKMYNKNERIFDNELKQIKQKLIDLEKSINGIIINDYSGLTKTVFFRYKDDKISVVCDNNISKNILDGCILMIEKYFSNLDKKYFNYGVFPITLVEEIYTPAGASL